MRDKQKDKTNKLLEAELSYKIRSCFYKVFNQYGPGLKEIVYQKALAEELENQGLNFVSNPRINIFSQETGKILGTYIPDFIVEDKIIIEIKALNRLTFLEKNQQMSYLRASLYEIAFLVNFGVSKLEINRLILTNDRKPFIRVNPSSIRTNPCFTLMEILIIIGLVALLATVALVLLNPKNQIAKAWDAKRKSDLNTLRKVFEDYYNDHGCYPTPDKVCYNSPNIVSGTYICNICGTEPTSPSFSPYLSKLPCDPQHPTYKYLYQVDSLSCPKWFRVYSVLSSVWSRETDDIGCGEGGCGPPPAYGYDYGVSSPNISFQKTPFFYCYLNTNSCGICSGSGGDYYYCYSNPSCVKIYPTRNDCCANHRGAWGCR